jgi:hypothetical protein
VSITIDGVLYVKARRALCARLCSGAAAGTRLVATRRTRVDDGAVSLPACAQVVDPKRASYGVENLLYAVVQLAQSAMRKCAAWQPHPNAHGTSANTAHARAPLVHGTRRSARARLAQSSRSARAAVFAHALTH